MPEFYLKRFCRDKHLWVYDAEREEIAPRFPETIAIKKRFYSAQGVTRVNEHDLEIFLSETESRAAPAIDRLDIGSRLSAADRYFLSLFAGLLKCRVPNFERWISNVLSDFLSRVGFDGLDPVIINCDGTTTFSSLWHKICRQMSVVNQSERMGFSPGTENKKVFLDSLLPKKVTPDDVRVLFEGVSVRTIIVDEMDRIEDQRTTTLLADTVKTLSDHSVDTTLILVGVADSVDGLIAEHGSIERALVQVRMPRMSRSELFEIIDRGLDEAGMTIDDVPRRQIADLSQGLPHFTHLLSLHAAQHAIGEERKRVTEEDVKVAIHHAVAKTQQTTVNTYHHATSSPRKNLYTQVLLACAMAKKDELGYFSATDVRGPMSTIMGQAYGIPTFARHLNDFCEKQRGPVLQKTGHERRFRYRFINPMMEPFVTMTGLDNGLITEDMLKGFS